MRDALLGLEIEDRDWVVTGSTPDEMLERGFRPVGRDFPVFLHPLTHEEYALARTERKVSAGYRGFTFHTLMTIVVSIGFGALNEDQDALMTEILKRSVAAVQRVDYAEWLRDRLVA